MADFQEEGRILSRSTPLCFPKRLADLRARARAHLPYEEEEEEETTGKFQDSAKKVGIGSRNSVTQRFSF